MNEAIKLGRPKKEYSQKRGINVTATKTSITCKSSSDVSSTLTSGDLAQDMSPLQFRTSNRECINSSSSEDSSNSSTSTQSDVSMDYYSTSEEDLLNNRNEYSITSSIDNQTIPSNVVEDQLISKHSEQESLYTLVSELATTLSNVTINNVHDSSWDNLKTMLECVECDVLCKKPFLTEQQTCPMFPKNTMTEEVREQFFNIFDISSSILDCTSGENNNFSVEPFDSRCAIAYWLQPVEQGDIVFNSDQEKIIRAVTTRHHQMVELFVLQDTPNMIKVQTHADVS